MPGAVGRVARADRAEGARHDRGAGGVDGGGRVQEDVKRRERVLGRTQASVRHAEGAGARVPVGDVEPRKNGRIGLQIVAAVRLVRQRQPGGDDARLQPPVLPADVDAEKGSRGTAMSEHVRLRGPGILATISWAIGAISLAVYLSTISL